MGVVAALLLGQALAPFAAIPIADDELAKMRGGFRLPSGLDIALTVQTQTAVDGKVVLRTVFSAIDGAPSIVAYVPKAGVSVDAPRASGNAATAAAAPVIVYDSRRGISITPGSVPITGVTASGAPQGLGEIPDGLERADLGSGVTQAARGGVDTVELTSDDLRVVHFSGAAFGSAIANTGNDRTIDTQTSVGIDIGNAAPDTIGSSMFRAETVALDALQGRVR